MGKRDRVTEVYELSRGIEKAGERERERERWVAAARKKE